MTRRERLEASLEARYGNMVAQANMKGPGSRGAREAMDRAGAKGLGNSGATIKRLLKYVAEEKGKMIGAIICTLCATLMTLATSYMLRPIINTYIVPTDGSEGDPEGLLLSLAGMLALYLLSSLFTWLQSKLLIRLGQNCLNRIRKDLNDALQTLPVRYYDTHPRGDIMSRFTNDVDNIGQMLSSTLISVFSAALTLVGTLALMIYTSWILTIVVVVLVPLSFAGIMAVSKASAKYFGMQQKSLGALNGYVEESVTGQKVIKVFNHEDTAIEEFDILNERLRSHQMKAQFFGGLMGPVSNASNQVVYVAASVVAGILCVVQGFDIGGMTVFLNYSRQFGRPLNELASQMTSVFSALAGAERVFHVMDETPEPADDADAYEFEKMKGDVVFDDVHFEYRPDHEILKGISLYAHPGQKIAFVGSTGAGKTTVMNVLNRFYDIKSGSVMVDGVDIRHYHLKELRKNIAVVLQETHLFTGTVMENIRYGRLDATDGEVIAAAKLANADSFIRRLPQGYNTLIEGDGANLSQGQRQLLNIARAAVTDAPVLVMDEATSSVDTRTEKNIEKGMTALMKDRTTFIIAHRLSTVRDSDAILVMEGGKIIERGTHEELLSQKGRYYELYTGIAELT